MRLSQITDQFKEKLEISEVVQDNDFSTLALAVSEIDMDFCTFIDDAKYVDQISSNASMVITTPEISSLIRAKGVCISQSPRISFFRLHNHLVGSDEYMLSKNFKTEIGHGCRISDMACIADRNVRIGNNVIIEEFVSIKENTIIGDNTFVGAGTVVGGDGYEFKRLPNGEVLSVKHAGWTNVGSNVEIQYNVCIDKAIYPWDATMISDFCKIDNLVHIAHGVKLGKAVFLVAGSLIGGRTIIKDRTWIGVGATISNGLIVGEGARVNIGAVATLNVEDGSAVTGNFAIEHKKFIQFIKSIG
jgi:UDP-3-O-[3-hydroxymyristoyl] glucosamine N-acyltransferase